MTELELQLDGVFDKWWMTFDDDVKVDVDEPSDDDKTWLAHGPSWQFYTLMQNPYLWAEKVGNLGDNEVCLPDDAFVINISVDPYIPNDMLVQGISGTGLVNVCVKGTYADGGNLVDRLSRVLLKGLIDDKSFDKLLATERNPCDPIPQMPAGLDPIGVDASTKCCNNLLTADFGRLFTHVQLVAAGSAQTAASVALFLAHVCAEFQCVTKWLYGTYPTNTAGDGNSSLPPHQHIELPSNPPQNIVYMGNRGIVNDEIEACLCMITKWVNGQPVQVQQACVKPYAG
jgi:hypothetical protein